ncbi:hypothetical protein QBC43DRAFT_312730 [Cladorrhinum sp. PSN259]|nr:hypothetical protein QBC43DRAFT_312730 [Cladorrhinum sp. PSN259]
MSSRGAVPNNGNENRGQASRLSPTNPMTLPVSRKRPRGDESSRYDGDSTIDGRSRSRRFSFAPESRDVRDAYTARERSLSMGHHSVTLPSVNTDAEEVNIRASSTTVEAELKREDDDDDTSASAQALPTPFRHALGRLNQGLENLDSFFYWSRKDDAMRHVDDINEQIGIIKDSHSRRYFDFCYQLKQNQELQGRLSQLGDQAKAVTQERNQANRGMQDLRKTIVRLQTSIKGLERDKTELGNSIKDLEDRNESLKGEKEKLEAVVEAKNTEIEALIASPVSAAHSTPVVADEGDHTHYKYDQLAFSITTFLSKLLKIDSLAHNQPSDGKRPNSVVAEFMFNLGSFANTADVPVSRADGFWNLRLPWTSTTTVNPTTKQRPSIETRFVKLCLLIPHLKSRSRCEKWCATVRLINSLMGDDHASAPHAGMAFLATMRSTNLVAEYQDLDIQNAALAIALCELCRFLQQIFIEAPQATWEIGNILGSEVQTSVTVTPIGRLSAWLAGPHRSNPLALRRQLATTCGDKFCFSSLDRQSQDKLEYGFLSCDDNETFLLLEFAKRSIRFVDRNLAYALQGGDRKKRLSIKAPDGEVLLDIKDAAQDVRVFWVKYAEHP